MTELKKLLVMVEGIESFLNCAKEDIHSVQWEEAYKQSTLLEDSLFQRTKKLLGKIDDIDLVTDKPRYGKNHREKVLELNERVSEVRRRMEVLVLNINGSEKETHADSDQGKFNSCIEEPGNIFNLNNTFTYNRRLKGMEATLMQAKEGEAEVSLDLHKEEKKCLRIVIATMHSSAESNFEAKHSFIKSKYAENPSGFASINNFLKSIIVNICSHPEDENLRRIRICHPVVFNKLVKLEGGIDMLLSMGFRITTAPLEAERPQEVIAFVNEHAHASNGGHLVSLGSISALLNLSEVLGLEVFLTMVEPPLEDVQTWGTWWDRLTSVRSIICEFM